VRPYRRGQKTKATRKLCAALASARARAAAIPSGGAGDNEEEEDETHTDVAELEAKNMEELTALREAWGGLPARVAAREAYFKFLLSWRWELKAVDRKNAADWFDKDPNAMLVFVTMQTPHVYDSTRSLDELLPGTVEEIKEDFSASEDSCAEAFLAHNDERRKKALVVLALS